MPDETTTPNEVTENENDEKDVTETPEEPKPVQELIPMPAKPAMIEEPEYKRKASQFLDPIAYRHMKLMAQDFIKSEAMPAGFKNAEQVLIAFQAGKEMGMQPFESLQSLYFVNGSLNIWGKAIMKRLRDHGWKLEYTNESDESCTAIVTKGDDTYKETYSFKDAEQSGYTKDGRGSLKFGWKLGMNRRLKLRYGALSLIIKSYLPEVLGGATNIVEVQEDAQLTDAAKAVSVAEYEERVRACQSLDELKRVWLDLPAAAREQLEGVKEDVKAHLQVREA